MFALWDRTFDVHRMTAYVLDSAAVSASHTATRQPAANSYIEVHVSGGTSNSGTITITGTVDADPAATEVLTFTTAGYKTTMKRFSSITTITTAGLADEVAVPTIDARAVGGSGDPVSRPYTVFSGLPGILKPYGQKWNAHRSTPAQETGNAKLKIPWLDVFLPRVGDRFVDTISGETWETVGAIGPERGRYRPREWELDVIQRQA